MRRMDLPKGVGCTWMQSRLGPRSPHNDACKARMEQAIANHCIAQQVAEGDIREEREGYPWPESQGFKQGRNDKCVFYHPERKCIVITYVDDLLIPSTVKNV